jgi:outer membrane protein
MQRTGIVLLVCLSILLLNLPEIHAQEVKIFSLKEAQQYALEHNYQIKNAKTDVEIASERVKENTAIGFPQISGKIGYTNYLELPTTLIDAEYFGGQKGQKAELKFGIQHNATWSATVSQLIFSGQYLVGLQAAKAYENLTHSIFHKNEIEIMDAIAKSYYPIIILKENKNYLDSTLLSMKKMLTETEEYYNNGFVEDTDVDQMKLIIADMETTLVYIDSQMELAYNMLKFMLGLKAEDKIEVSETLDGLLAATDTEFLANSKFDFNNNIDYKMLKKSEQLSYLQMRLSQSAYLPTMSAFYSYQQNDMNDKFVFLNFDHDWYPSQILGVQLDVPIWSSGMRKYKVNQAKMELDKIKVKDIELQQKLNLDLETGRNEFNNAYLIYNNRHQNLEIAKKIYQKTEIKYKEGVSTSLDLSQSYNQYLKAEMEYLTSILDLLMKKSDLDKLLTKADY